MKVITLLTEIIDFLEAFPDLNPQIFESFPGFPEYDSQKNNFLIFIDVANANSERLRKVLKFAKANNLMISKFRCHLIIYNFEN